MEDLLSYEESLDFLREVEVEAGQRLEVDSKKHKLFLQTTDRSPIWRFRLPLPMPAISEAFDLSTYLIDQEEEPRPYVIAIIQAGAAALGYFEEGEVLHHKVIKKYMKRHKRGKSQITYLNTRGKSKAGSRIRLANTVRFFEEINERLTLWEETFEPERILYSCSPQLWGLMFQSKVSPPFEKDDTRLVKIPMDVHIPSFEEMLRVNEYCLHGSLLR
ncbi:MAG: hypothetical protein AAF206_12075 [Bacteroidota bacterium]